MKSDSIRSLLSEYVKLNNHLIQFIIESDTDDSNIPNVAIALAQQDAVPVTSDKTNGSITLRRKARVPKIRLIRSRAEGNALSIKARYDCEEFLKSFNLRNPDATVFPSMEELQSMFNFKNMFYTNASAGRALRTVYFKELRKFSIKYNNSFDKNKTF